MTTKKTASPRTAARKKTARRVLRTTGKTGMFTRERLRQAVLNVETKTAGS